MPSQSTLLHKHDAGNQAGISEGDLGLATSFQIDVNSVHL